VVFPIVAPKKKDWRSWKVTTFLLYLTFIASLVERITGRTDEREGNWG